MKLVSAILPTRGRKALARQALECFLSQTYENKELVILDDIDDLSFDGLEIVPILNQNPNVRFYYSGDRWIPRKRNMCCERAAGEIIMHFDSDDWSASERMADQVARLESSGLALTGYHSMLFYDMGLQLAYKYVGVKNYAVGTSLTYFRSWWKERPFKEEKNTGEDNLMVWHAAESKQLVSVDAEQKMVARIHSGNSCSKVTKGTNYNPVNVIDIPLCVRAL